jgi:general secretion pathway protein A
MYEEFYGLKEPPFNLTPDPHYFYRSEAHNHAFEQLKYGIQRREGFMILYGDIGLGKTTLCRAVLESMQSNVHTALLLNPFLLETDLLKAILDDFGIGTESDSSTADPQPRQQFMSKQSMIDLLNKFLLNGVQSDSRAVVLIDEAQNLPLATLEQIRILSNLETAKEKLLQIILIGQVNLLDVLSRPDLRQLYQRVSIKCELVPLTGEEVGDYLRHRLTVAGGTPAKVSFTPDGVREVYAYSGGVPRLINLIADRALLAGMAMNTARINKKAVKKAAQALQLQKHPTVHHANVNPSKSQWVKRVALTFGLSLLVAAAVIAIYFGRVLR